MLSVIPQRLSRLHLGGLAGGEPDGKQDDDSQQYPCQDIHQQETERQDRRPVMLRLGPFGDVQEADHHELSLYQQSERGSHE